MVTLDPPPDLVEIAEALDIMAQPHVGSGWANLNFDGLPCSTPRQEAIWMEHNDHKGRLGDGQTWLRAVGERLLPEP